MAQKTKAADNAAFVFSGQISNKKAESAVTTITKVR